MQKLILPLILFSFNAFIPSLTAEQNETNQSLWKGDISAQENLKTFIEKTGVQPLEISAEKKEGMDEILKALYQQVFNEPMPA